METKQCTQCGEVKELSEFSKTSESKDGLRNTCKTCVNIHSRAYYKTNKDKIQDYRKANKHKRTAYNEANKDKIKAYAAAYREANKGRKKNYNKDACVLQGIRIRSRQKGLEFNLDLEDMTYPEFCPVFGFKLERSNTGSPAKNSPSVDRIDPTKGYVKGNIQMISQLANSMKSNATPEELLMFADWIIKTYRK